MQIYIDLIKQKMQKGVLDPNKVFLPMLNKLGIDATATKLDILKSLLDVLQTVHYLAGINDLPLDDAYSAVLTSGGLFDKEPSVDKVEKVLRDYTEGKLKKSASPIHALMERVEEVKRENSQAVRDYNVTRNSGME